MHMLFCHSAERLPALQVCGIRLGKLGVEQVIVIQILQHYPAHFDIVPLPGELHHHPLADECPAGPCPRLRSLTNARE